MSILVHSPSLSTRIYMSWATVVRKRVGTLVFPDIEVLYFLVKFDEKIR